MKSRHPTSMAILTMSLATILISPTAYANWGVSASLANQKTQYKDGANNISIFPDIVYRENHPKKQSWMVSYDITLTSKNAGFRAQDGNVFKGMKSRNNSLDIGGHIAVSTPLFPLTFEVSKDLVASKGYQGFVKLGGVSHDDTGHFQVRPYVGIRYQSASVIDYHYGVRKSEKTASRKAYKGESATTPFLGVEAMTKFTPNIQMNASIDLEQRAGSIRNSPLVDNNKHDLKGSVRLTYWF